MKILMTILSVMLVIVIVFTTFGISVRDSSGQINFFSAFGKVENFIGDFSTTTMDIYNGVKDFVTEISPSFTRLLSTIKNVFKRLNEIIGFTDALYEFLDMVIDFIRRCYMSFDIIINHVIEFGTDLLDGVWWRKLSFSLSCMENPEFYISDDNFNYDKLYKVLRAFFDGEQNEYTYMFNNDKLEDISKSDSFINKEFADTYVFYNPLTLYSYTATIEDIYYFQTVDVTLPHDFMPYLDNISRITNYLDGNVFPVGDTDIYYNIDGRIYYLIGVMFESADGVDLFGEGITVRFYDCDFLIYFQFLYVDSENNTEDYISVSALDYFDIISNDSLFNKISDVYIMDELLYYADGLHYTSGEDVIISPLPE